VRFVVNKVDLPAAWAIEGVPALRVSALTGAGLAEFCEALASWLVPDVPPRGVAVPFTPVLAEAVTEARRLAERGDCQTALAKLGKVQRECG
jgi:tRNA modification GTPase